KGGGSIYSLDRIQSIRAVCRKHGLALHLDGARLFNALVETGDTPAAIGAEVDSVSLCLSKGLGAPVGSVLIGNQRFIAEARRVRKVMGGGMRQAGYLAAAGIYALDHHIERLREDHAHARQLAAVLAELPYVANIRPVQTNIVIFDLVPAASAAERNVSAAKAAGTTPALFLEYLSKNGVKASAFGPQTIRFVTHLDVTKPMINKVGEILKAFPG
nr:threonine aldolase [Saprospiraceae bacterium]